MTEKAAEGATDDLAARLQQAADQRFTGTIYGPVFDDPQTGKCQQVYEYSNGDCTDAFVTKAGVQL